MVSGGLVSSFEPLEILCLVWKGILLCRLVRSVVLVSPAMTTSCECKLIRWVGVLHEVSLPPDPRHLCRCQYLFQLVVLVFFYGASGFDYMCAFVRDLLPSMLILVERNAQDMEALALFARSLGYTTVVSRWDNDDRHCAGSSVVLESLLCRAALSFFFFIVGWTDLRIMALTVVWFVPLLLLYLGPSQFVANFPSVGSGRARVASLSTRSPTSSFHCLTFLLCASAAFCLCVAVLMLAMSRSSSARSRLTFRAA
ncbi:uncharacterized protein G2W53_039659 [Senna tora]|uniref:Uncharacterized protein n=1 Tax=Senna tora TaxID=362788 RepID=A0A834W3S4_9FABA|nr:uncharacterized protein G2W53_039659 [Senna tora]